MHGVWVSDTYHTTESKRLKEASERAKTTSEDTPNGPISFLEKVIFDNFLTIFDPFSVDTQGPKSPKMRLDGQQCIWAILRGGNHLKWGFARGKSVHGFAIRSV